MIDRIDADAALARELDMLAQVAADPNSRHLWLWESPRCLVAPNSMARLPEFDDAVDDVDWPVHLRATGGDVTPQGPGVVNVSHVYSTPVAGFDLSKEYARLCAPIEAALGENASIGWQPGAFCDGAYNVQWNGLKFAGTAMRFRPCRDDKSRMAVLAHALMLFETPGAEAIEAINGFLKTLNQGRTIDPAAHTGLPEGLSPQDFLKRLLRGFD